MVWRLGSLNFNFWRDSGSEPIRLQINQSLGGNLAGLTFELDASSEGSVSASLDGDLGIPCADSGNLICQIFATGGDPAVIELVSASLAFDSNDATYPFRGSVSLADQIAVTVKLGLASWRLEAVIEGPDVVWEVSL